MCIPQETIREAMSELTVLEKIRSWSDDRNITKGSTKHAQMIKLIEEFGELASGFARSKQDLIKDSLGDCAIVLTILAHQMGYKIEDCIAEAYNEIKDRKGRMVSGVFVKESDL